MFDSLIGNSNVKTFISKLICEGRFPNSAIFAGPDGVGKKAFALEAARAFVCSATEGSGRCPTCLRASRFNIPKPEKKDDFKEVFFSEHPDVGMVVPFNRNVLVDAIRSLEVEANYRPYEARGRFFIIDDADKMNDAASNALLKTLEEPSATSHIILVTSRPDSLLQTIRSRSQVIRFSGIEAAEIEAHLSSGGQWKREDAVLAARTCGGSIARALSLDIEKFRQCRSTMLDILDALSIKKVASVLQSAERLNDAKNKEDLESNLVIMESLIRDTWLLKNGGVAASLTNCDVAPKLSTVASRLDAPTLAGWLGEIESMRGNFIVNINRKIATDALFVKMAVGV